MKKAIYLFAIIIALISCKEDKKIVKKDKISNFKINLIFPDTVYIDKEYSGEKQHCN